MHLAEQLLERLDDPALSRNEHARLRCQLAKEMEDSGDYEAARSALGELWQRIDERPNLEGLAEEIQAEILLRVGVLTGWVGSARQIEEAQETAKNLITESATISEQLGDTEKVDEAQTELAYCYWRQGAFDEARAILQELSERLADNKGRIKPVALLRSGIVECSAQRYHDALRIYTEIAPLFEGSDSNSLRGKFHNEFGIVLDILGTSEKRGDYIDRAFIEYTAASFHFEEARHFRYCGCVENNLAMLYLAVGRLAEAHEHLDRAQRMLASLKDGVHLAQVYETRAKTLLAEGRKVEAEKVAGVAVQILEQGDEQSILAEALTTHGVALARTGRHGRARQTLQRAVAVAEQAGDSAAAGRASLTIIEELSEHAGRGELCGLYEQAAEGLARSQHPNMTGRLIAGARVVFRLLKVGTPGPEDAPVDWRGFSFRKAVWRYERVLIERALRDAGGVVTRAAELLGFKHHQSLISLLNSRHKDLLTERSPAVPRKRSIMRDGSARKRRGEEKQTRAVTILHAEDDGLVAEAVKDTLEMEGWRVVTCGDGACALRRIEGNAPLDVLLLDYELPQFDGLEITRRARQLRHRRRTPIIVLSAGDLEREARRAGADVFLRKPEDVVSIAEKIARLLALHPRRL